MIGYIIFFLSIILIDKSHLSLSNKYKLAFIIISIFSGIRYGIGYDYFMYYEFILENNIEREFIPLKMMQFAHNTHFSWFFILSSIFINYFFIKGLEIRKVKFSSIYFYIGFPLFLFFSFSTVRQSMAFSVLFYMMCLNKPSIILKLILLTIAFLCHRSALIGILLLFNWNSFSKRKLWTIWISCLFIGESISMLVKKLSSDATLIVQFQRFMEIDFGGGFFKRILIYIITTFVLFKYDSLIKAKHDYHRFIVYTCIGGCLYAIFNPMSHIAERFCGFYFTSILIYIPLLIRKYKIPRLFYIIACISLFVMSVYVGHITSTKGILWHEYRKSLYYPYMTIFEI